MHVFTCQLYVHVKTTCQQAWPKANKSSRSLLKAAEPPRQKWCQSHFLTVWTPVLDADRVDKQKVCWLHWLPSTKRPSSLCFQICDTHMWPPPEIQRLCPICALRVLQSKAERVALAANRHVTTDSCCIRQRLGDVKSCWNQAPLAFI